MGLSSAHRLKNHQDYRTVYEQGIRRYSPHLTLVALRDAENGKQEVNSQTKIGISIGKKVSKKAVIRNRIKRQIRSAITSNLRTMAPGWKIVIVVRPEAIKCKYEHFLRELEELLKQAKIINGY